jgi:putative MATE family efflux protein
MIESKFKQDLTEGSIGKNLLKLSIPMTLGMFLQMVFYVVDMIFVGFLGSAAIAAVSMSGLIMILLITLGTGLSSATSALVARAIGAKNPVQGSHITVQSFAIVTIMSVVVGILGYIYARQVYQLIGATADIIEVGLGYLKISFAGTFPFLFVFIGNAALRGAGDAVLSAKILGLSIFLNIALDPLLIFGWGPFPRLGVDGAAYATVISLGIGSIMTLYLLVKGSTSLHITLQKIRLDTGVMWQLIKIAVPGSSETFLRSLARLALMKIVTPFGTAAAAAFGIGASRLDMVITLPTLGLSLAAATLVGQNLGAQKPDRAEESAWTAVRWGVTIMLVIAVLFFVFAPGLIRVFDNNPEVVSLGTSYLRMTTLSYVFLGTALILGRSFTGAGDTVPPLITASVALWGVQIPLAYFLANHTQLKLNGVWLSIVISHTLNAIFLVIWFKAGRWKSKRCD